eukprot:jgi/Hompol1/6260/HPOL_004924-RA
MALTVYALLASSGSTKRTSFWSTVYVALSLLLLFAAGEALLVHDMVAQQHALHQQRAIETEFVPLLPLDFTFFQYSYRDVVRLLVRSGELGRASYAAFLLIDTIAISSFLWFHRSFLAVLYEDDDEVTGFIFDLVAKLPAAYAGLDLFENICAATCLAFFALDAKLAVPFVLTNPFIAQMGLATRAKLSVMYILLGFEATGIINPRNLAGSSADFAICGNETTQVTPQSAITGEHSSQGILVDTIIDPDLSSLPV